MVFEPAEAAACAKAFPCPLDCAMAYAPVQANLNIANMHSMSQVLAAGKWRS